VAPTTGPFEETTLATARGTDKAEFKSQQVSVILTPTKKVTWQVNYYVGREQRDLRQFANAAGSLD
jgi:hypothetical protein